MEVRKFFTKPLKLCLNQLVDQEHSIYLHQPPHTPLKLTHGLSLRLFHKRNLRFTRNEPTEQPFSSSIYKIDLVSS